MVRSRVVLLVVLFGVLGSCALLPGGSSGSSVDAVAAAEEIPAVPALVVLDASGSMKADDAPGVRFVAAQAAVTSLVEVLPEGHKIGLDVYGTSTGSKDSEEKAGCRDIETAVPFGKLDKSAFTAKVKGLRASGYTPIAAALTKAAGELPTSGKRAVVLVSDGIDTCAQEGLGEDPCEVAKDLHAKDEDLVVHTVGFKVEGDPAAAEQLSCIAAATGGLDLDASNGRLLRTRLAAAFNPALAAKSIQPSGYRGLELGMDLKEARKVAPDLGEVKVKGRVVVKYVDCDLVFQDGVLTEVRSASPKVRTLDGVKVGDDVTTAERLYGAPSTPTERSGNTVTYAADAVGGSGYRLTFKPSGDAIAGEITTIVLCGCAPIDRGGQSPDEWRVGPGFLGPFTVGDRAEDLEARGLISRDDAGAMCGFKWEDTFGDLGVGSEYRVGDPDDLDQVTFYPRDSAAPSIRTSAGLGPGSTVEALRLAYPDLEWGFWPGEGIGSAGYTTFGPLGALTFLVEIDLTDYDSESTIGEDRLGDVVVGVAVNPGSTPSTFAGVDSGGC